MNARLIAIVALTLAGCGSTYQPREVEAVRDYVVANELEEVDRIRLTGQLSFTYINNFFVTIPTRREDFLVEFSRECRELTRTEFTPDMVDQRDNQSILRSRFDTIRGCRIGTIYEITEYQREEIRELGDAPGDEVFIPGDTEEADDAD